MNFNQAEAPEEDSPDLTDEEIADAVPTSEAREMAKGILDIVHCPVCKSDWAHVSALARRRKPNLYSRMTFKCTNGHVLRKTFVANWMV